MFLSLPELQKERGFPHPSRKKKLLKSKRESTCSISRRLMASGQGEDACSADMLVLIRWQSRTTAVPLSQLAGVNVDESTAEAIAD